MDVLLITDPMFWVMRGPGSDHRRTKWRSHSLIALGPITQQLRQLGDIGRDPPRLVFSEQLGCGATGRNDLYLL
jgi:hypothetical protein